MTLQVSVCVGAQYMVEKKVVRVRRDRKEWVQGGAVE